jgi:hypothetical protein
VKTNLEGSLFLAVPDIVERGLADEDEFLVLACDGNKNTEQSLRK